jgi:syntaxin-binding protein 1
VLETIQRNGTLCSKIKTFKEINLDFVSSESNVFHFDMPLTLPKLLGHAPDSNCPKVLGEKLATTCITLNEFPSIRYQASSRFATEMATTVVKILSDFKQANKAWWCNGEGEHQDRERGTLLLLDRSFDPISPLMHEYTYQTMVNDLLPIKDGVISYKAEQNQGSVEKKVLLNENDELWVELRHFHIAKVIEIIKERMADIIQNNAGAALHKNSGSDMSITKMAAAVKELPEYRETMTKLGQHVNIAQQCMDAFHKLGLMDLSQLEQTMSTGVDEDGKECKGPELVQMLGEALSNQHMPKVMKIRLLAIFIISQRNTSAEDRGSLTRAAGLTGAEQQILLNFEKIGSTLQTAGADKKKGNNSLMSMFRGKAAPKHAATAEGDYADTRHVCRLKVLLEQLMNNELPTADFAAAGPSAGGAGESKSAAKSVRRYGANSRWGRRDQTMFSGGRFLVFIAGGVAYNELRTGHDLMTQHTKEVVIGGSHIINPSSYIHDVAALHPSSIAAMDLFL